MPAMSKPCALLGAVAALLLGVAGPAAAAPHVPAQQAVAQGTGGGAATMSPYATRAAISVLRSGGNAVDAAVAAAATLGVTEPFVAGPGGGGYFVYYRARDHRVFTIDGRETAPASARPDLFVGADGQPIDFEEAVESGLSVGVPGQGATWGAALDRFGTRTIATVLRPAEQVARRGFVLDQALVDAIAEQQSKLSRFPASAALYLPAGQVPAPGTVVRNPDLASAYRQIGDRGWRWFYTGPIAGEIAATVTHPQTVPGREVAPGTMTAADLAGYRAVLRKPVTWSYRGYDLYGMGPSSSGDTTVGEAMNVLERFDQTGAPRIDALYRYLEASKLAYADRGQYVGDTAFVAVPVRGLLSDAFAAQRAALIGPTALATPVAPGDPWAFQGEPSGARPQGGGPEHEQHTNHLVVADRWGNVVSYTNTIEQIAGSGMTVPGRGFLLNNELTDFNFPPGTANSVAPGKRPRSSMSPTIVLKGGKVVEALGSPGGATIITTVLQTLLNQIDFGMTLPESIEAPRASARNGSAIDAEPAFIDAYGAALAARGERFAPVDQIGIAAGLTYLPDGRLQTATESWRGGGGSAMVVRGARGVPQRSGPAPRRSAHDARAGGGG